MFPHTQVTAGKFTVSLTVWMENDLLAEVLIKLSSFGLTNSKES